MKIIESNDGNINQIIYYLFKNNNDEEYISIILKEILSLIKNKSNIKLNDELFINLSLYKGKTIENKFLIIEIFQLLYHNYNKEVIDIFVDNKLNNQIFYNTLKNFIECNIIDKNNNEEILQDKIYLKEIIKNYFLFSIHYLNDNYNFDLDIPNNFTFDKYIELINKDFKELNNSNINYYRNEIIKKSLFNILIYSKLYIENNDDNLKTHLSNIFEDIMNILLKIINFEIKNNMIYKSNDKDIHYNSIFPFLKIIIRIIIQNNNNKLIFNIIDDLLYNSLNKITNINILNDDNFLSINNPEFEKLQKYMNEILKQFKKSNNINKPLEKLNTIQKINPMKKNTFSEFLIEKYINKEKEQDLTKMNNMFKYLNTIFMIFIQFFLEKEKFNEENIDLYLIFIYIIIDLNKQINKNVKTESKNEIIKNIDYLFYYNMLIISYLCLKNEKKEYKNIFDNIIEYSKSKNGIFFLKY